MYRAKAYAKANLCLNVTGRRGEFHTLDMLNTSIDLCDELTLNFRDDHKVTIKVEAEDLPEFSPKLFADSIKRVLPILSESYKFNGVDIYLKKNIPPGGGFGGSSACGAAAAKLIAKASGEEPTTEHLLDLGSDIPFVYEGGAKRVQGIGEIITPVDLPELTLLLVKPKGGVFSRECFGMFDKVGTNGEADIEKVIEALKNGDLKTAAQYTYNQLSESSEKLNSDIAKVKKTLKNLGAEFVIMSGSGSGVCAVVSDVGHGEEIREVLPKKWWSKVVKTILFGVEIL
jgi:4-diphosphocytidyl-2-C-methyl-D-erythritol kinase